VCGRGVTRTRRPATSKSLDLSHHRSPSTVCGQSSKRPCISRRSGETRSWGRVIYSPSPSFTLNNLAGRDRPAHCPQSVGGSASGQSWPDQTGAADNPFPPQLPQNRTPQNRNTNEIIRGALMISKHYPGHFLRAHHTSPKRPRTALNPPEGLPRPPLVATGFVVAAQAGVTGRAGGWPGSELTRHRGSGGWAGRGWSACRGGPP
jgi:hypothetical protein